VDANKGMSNTRDLHTKAMLALKEAVRGVIEEHKRTGRPLAIWKDGKVKWVRASRLLRKGK